MQAENDVQKQKQRRMVSAKDVSGYQRPEMTSDCQAFLYPVVDGKSSQSDGNAAVRFKVYLSSLPWRITDGQRIAPAFFIEIWFSSTTFGLLAILLCRFLL